ncbi:MAG: hypothetical protein KAV00_15025 [Phycisphaerae bacterium]|nr:hypothetical protein [Phycisphaerae bacterium]
MDILQPLQSRVFTLEEASAFLNKHGDTGFSGPTRLIELLVTWMLAGLLQSVQHKEYRVGFPVIGASADASLEDLVYGDIVTEDLEFDTVITGGESERYIQVKRFMPKGRANTESLITFIKEKVYRYGEDPKLHIIFFIPGAKRHGQVDTESLHRLLAVEPPKVGGVSIAGVGKPAGAKAAMPYIVEVHPGYTRWVKPTKAQVE